LFGLAQNQRVDEVNIRWPSGLTTALKNIPARRYLTVQEQQASPQRPNR